MRLPEVVLKEAAEYISVYGHHKGSFYGPNGAVCAVGALMKVCTGGEIDMAIELLETKIANIYNFDPRLDVGAWNDLETTTAQHVIDVLRGDY